MKNIAILVEQQYEDLELWYPKLRFQEENFTVDLIGVEEGKEYPSKHGYPVKTTKSIFNVRADDYDAIVITGGFAPDYLRRTPAFIDFVRDAGIKKKIIAAICHGGWILCSADLIQGKKVTSFYAIKDDMKNAGGEWVDRQVVVAENIVTARKPDDLPMFCKTIINKLLNDEQCID